MYIPLQGVIRSLPPGTRTRRKLEDISSLHVVSFFNSPRNSIIIYIYTYKQTCNTTYFHNFQWKHLSQPPILFKTDFRGGISLYTQIFIYKVYLYPIKRRISPGICIIIYSWGKWWYPWDGTLNNQPHIHLI